MIVKRPIPDPDTDSSRRAQWLYIQICNPQIKMIETGDIVIKRQTGCSMVEGNERI